MRPAPRLPAQWLIKRSAELPDAVETPDFVLGFYTW